MICTTYTPGNRMWHYNLKKPRERERRMKVVPVAVADADDFNSRDEEKKVLLVSAKFEEKPRRWFKIDPRCELEEKREICSMGCGERPKLDIVRALSYAVVESNVYFIGGIPDFPLHDSSYKEVHVYNIKSATWSSAPPLNYPRINPLVFVVGRKIYVFGTCFCPPRGMHVPAQDWVECLDLDSGSGWKTFSAPAQDQERFFSLPLDVGVVHGDQIRFWVPCSAGIFAFNLSSNTWSFTRAEEIPFLHDGDSPRPPPNFMSNHVVFGHVVLWHFRAKLYCWDLTKDTTLELCSLNLPGASFPKLSPGFSQLLHLGNGLLCLLRWPNIVNKSELCCYKFQIDETLLQSGIGGVHAAGVQFFDFPGTGIGRTIVV